MINSSSPSEGKPTVWREPADTVIWPIGGSKGGIGKSTLAANLSLMLAKKLLKRDKKVVLVDADLECGNLSLFFGVDKPQATLRDFMATPKSVLEDVVVDTCVDTLKLIVGSVGAPGFSNLKYFQKVKFVNQITKLNFDYVIIDLGAGSSYNVIDLFLMSDEGIMVTLPDRTSVYSTYGFLKSCFLRKILGTLPANGKASESIRELIGSMWLRKSTDKFMIEDLVREIERIDPERAYAIEEITSTFKPKLVVNMVTNETEKAFGERLRTFLYDSLNLDVEFLGYLDYDASVRDASKMMRPAVLEGPDHAFTESIDSILRNLMGYDQERMRFFKDFDWSE